MLLDGAVTIRHRYYGTRKTEFWQTVQEGVKRSRLAQPVQRNWHALTFGQTACQQFTLHCWNWNQCRRLPAAQSAT